jgi:RNA polymerase sigma factor (TIGR02999 family)
MVAPRRRAYIGGRLPAVVTHPLPGPAAPLTQLLDAAARGDRGAFDRAFAFLYEELRVIAHAQRRRWQGNDTLDTRVLVHEAYLKLVRPDEPDAADAPPRWEGRRHFFALAAQVMRHVLANYAEQQRAAKRGGDAERVDLNAVDAAAEVLPPEQADELLVLHEALTRLEARDPRQARIVECRFFAGLSIPETAEALDVSPATVKREWAEARAWLHAELAATRDA